MARRHTSFQNPKSIASTALVGLGIVIMVASLDGPAAQLTNLLGSAACEALNALPSFVLPAWQVLQGYAFDHQWFSPCPLDMLVSFLSLLPAMAWAV